MRCTLVLRGRRVREFSMEEGEERIAGSYSDNYRRLAAIKAKYDSDKLFHVNQNIKPEA